MKVEPRSSKLRELAPEQIRRNPDNPRLFFRGEELSSLMASISRYGIQVPVTVYEDGDHYTLLDGERRWRCADKLNLKKIPALVVPKPSQLENLLLMFNIHALREQWDYMTIANKLPEVIELFKKENGRAPNETELSEATGLTRGQIRRCRFLLDLPAKYKRILLEELSLPKQKQQLSEDFFIEMERSLKTTQNRLPEVVPDVDEVRDVLIKKFRKGVIGNITDFRKLSKIATSIHGLNVKETQAKAAVKNIFSDNQVGIDEVYAEQFEFRYDERKVTLNIESVSEFLRDLYETQEDEAVGIELRDKLLELRQLIDKVLEELK